MLAHSSVAAVSHRPRRTEIDATISVRPYSSSLPVLSVTALERSTAARTRARRRGEGDSQASVASPGPAQLQFQRLRAGRKARMGNRGRSREFVLFEWSLAVQFPKYVGSSARTRTWNPSVNSCEKGFQRQTVRRGDTLRRMAQNRMFIGDSVSAALATRCEAN